MYYLVSGHSKVGYISMEDWNPYFQRLHGLHVNDPPQFIKPFHITPLPIAVVDQHLTPAIFRYTRLTVETCGVRMYSSQTTCSLGECLRFRFRGRGSEEMDCSDSAGK